MGKLLLGFFMVCLLGFTLAGTAIIGAQGDPPVATLVPPTLFPASPSATPYVPITRSALARIRERDPQSLVVGVYSNRPPFAAITDTGDYEGFEADIARAIVEDWGIRVQFRQVTRHNAYELLQRGEIDILIGQQLISRDLPDFLDFSDPYFVGRQVALGMADTQGDIPQLAGQTVGVVIGSAAEEAFLLWAAANGMAVTTNRYPMLDDAFRDLADRKIFAVVADRWELDYQVRGKIEGVRLLGGVFRTDPYGIAMLRYDDSLRTVINRTLQRLVKSERFKQIYDRWFPAGLMPLEDRVYPPVWNDLDGDTRTVSCAGEGECQAFPADIVRPARSVVEKLKAGEPLMVAGLGTPPDASGQTSILEQFNAALVYEMARRWGIGVALVPNSYANPEEVLASGGADLAVSLTPHWSTVDRIDFVGIYAERGYRMAVRVGSEVENFSSLRRGRRVFATFADEPEAFEIARKLAISVGIPEQTIQHVPYRNEQDAVQSVFDQSARLLFGDALRIVPLAQRNKPYIQLTATLYEKKPLSFGVPRNDVDFRMLVEATLQEMYRDGTYQRLWAELWNMDEPLKMIVLPGSGSIFGIKITG